MERNRCFRILADGSKARDTCLATVDLMGSIHDLRVTERQCLTVISGSIRNRSPMLQPIPKGLRLEFRHGSIYGDAVEGLEQLLISGSTEELILEHCTLDKLESLATGLEKNQSLQSFAYIDLNPHRSLMEAIPTMLASNRRIEKLCVDPETVQHNSYTLLQAIETGKTLKSLSINSQFSVMLEPTIQRIVHACLATDSLKELNFSDAKFSPSALQSLLQQLSERAVINSLWLPDSFFAENWSRCPKIQSQLAKVKVRRLLIGKDPLVSRSLLDEIATIGYIQHLSIRNFHVNFFDDHFVHWLRDIQRPIDLILTDARPTLTTIPPVANDGPFCGGLKSITCQTWHNFNLVDFTRRLADLRGVRELTIREYPTSAFTEAFFATLARTLLQSGTLCTVSLHADLSQVLANPSIRKHIESIRRSLAKNRVSQFLVTDQQGQVPASLWPWVLASSSSDPEGIFFALKEIPNIVEWGARVPVAASPAILEDDTTTMPAKRARLS